MSYPDPSVFAHSRFRSPCLLLVLGVAVGACLPTPETSETTFSEAPAVVVASFTTFIEEHRSPIADAVEAAGYHLDGAHPQEQKAKPLDGYVSQVRADQAEAELYEARLMIGMHWHLDSPEGFPMPRFISLEFATSGNEGKWILLTENGYPFDLGADLRDSTDRPPLDLIVGIRNVFEDRAEVVDWWAFRCQVLRDEGLIHDRRDDRFCDRFLGAPSDESSR